MRSCQRSQHEIVTTISARDRDKTPPFVGQSDLGIFADQQFAPYAVRTDLTLVLVYRNLAEIKISFPHRGTITFGLRVVVKRRPYFPDYIFIGSTPMRGDKSFVSYTRVYTSKYILYEVRIYGKNRSTR